MKFIFLSAFLLIQNVGWIETAGATSFPRLVLVNSYTMTAKEALEYLGCTHCHKIAGISSSQKATIGPSLVGRNYKWRLGDPRYKGNATTVREYLKESIINPKVYVGQNYSNGVLNERNTMPEDYEQKMAPLVIEQIVDYLADSSINKPNQ